MKATVLVLLMGLVFTSSVAAQQLNAGLTKLQAEGTGIGNTPGASGTLIGDPIGVGTWTMSFAPGFATSNGRNGFCTLGSGDITIVAEDKSTIVMEHGGVSCNTGTATIGMSPAINNTGYIITSGTGRFANATGTGNVVLGWYNAPEHHNHPP
jgi:hypothetical protein